MQNNDALTPIQLNQALTTLDRQMTDYFASKQLQAAALLTTLETLKARHTDPEPEVHPSWPFCKNGHALMWDRTEAMDRPCSICKEEDKAGFWACETCGERYCGRCYTPLFRKGRCPMGHALVAVLAVFERCTVCGRTLKMSGAQDLQCRFSLCSGCRDSYT